LITSIIFSKNRPLQLDLCLNSIYKNFPDSTNNIVIYYHSPEFESAYKQLQNSHNNVDWWKQSGSIFKDILVAVGSSQHDYICFFTDDDIVYDVVPRIDEDLFNNPGVACVSLRMGMNIQKRKHLGSVFPDLPSEVIRATNDYIYWNRTKHPYGSYWSYSLSVDGHIFRKNNLWNMMEELCLLEQKYKWKQNPNELEAAMQRFWAITPPLIVSPENSVVVNSPNNRVSDSGEQNMSGEDFTFCEEDFLKDFLKGVTIDMELLDFKDISCPHTEINLIKGLP